MHDFLAKFRTRRLLCQTLVDLTQQQQKAIDSSDYDELIDVLKRKDRILDRLSEGEEAIRDWKTNRHTLAAEVRSECEQLLTACQGDLESVQANTEQQTRVITEQREETADRLRKLTAGTASRGDFHNTEPRGSTIPRFPRGALH